MTTEPPSTPSAHGLAVPSCFRFGTATASHRIVLHRIVQDKRVGKGDEGVSEGGATQCGRLPSTDKKFLSMPGIYSSWYALKRHNSSGRESGKTLIDLLNQTNTYRIIEKSEKTPYKRSNPPRYSEPFLAPGRPVLHYLDSSGQTRPSPTRRSARWGLYHDTALAHCGRWAVLSLLR